MTPPHGVAIDHFLKVAKILKPHVDALNVTDNQRALMRMSGLACCARLVQEGIDPIFQITCRDRNILALQSELAWRKCPGNQKRVSAHGRSRFCRRYAGSQRGFPTGSRGTSESYYQNESGT